MSRRRGVRILRLHSTLSCRCEEVGCIECYRAFLPARTVWVSCHELAEVVRQVKAVEVQQNELHELLMRGQPPNSIENRRYWGDSSRFLLTWLQRQTCYVPPPPLSPVKGRSGYNAFRKSLIKLTQSALKLNKTETWSRAPRETAFIQIRFTLFVLHVIDWTRTMC